MNGEHQPDWQAFLNEAQCIVHMNEFDPECTVCLGEIEAFNRFLAKVQQRNGATEQRIAYLGQSIQMVDVLQLRLNTFIELLLQNPKMRARFEITYAIACEEALRMTEERVNRERLTVPIQGLHLR